MDLPRVSGRPTSLQVAVARLGLPPAGGTDDSDAVVPEARELHSVAGAEDYADSDGIVYPSVRGEDLAERLRALLAAARGMTGRQQRAGTDPKTV